MNQKRRLVLCTDSTGLKGHPLFIEGIGKLRESEAFLAELAGVNYVIERSTNVAGISSFGPLATNVLGQAGVTSYLDLNAASTEALFYRAGVGD